MSQKIVINTCYGGFSLSPRAIKRIAELQGRECYFFNDFKEEMTACSLEELEKSKNNFWYAFDIPDIKKLNDNWHNLSKDERKHRNDEYNAHVLSNRYIERNNPILIQVVEELGEKANGYCAELNIVEIPDDVEWEIEEYDGLEHVSEKHRTWS